VRLEGRLVRIVIDTNALESDRYAQRPVADVAWRGAAAGDFELVVPEAVVAELVKHFPEKLHHAVTELQAALKKHGRELDTFGVDPPLALSVDQAELSSGYEAALRALY
jgi:predicted nucleic acid-binding protein